MTTEEIRQIIREELEAFKVSIIEAVIAILQSKTKDH